MEKQLIPIFLSFLGLGWSVAGVLAWKKWNRMERKQDKLCNLVFETRENYVKKADCQHDMDQLRDSVK